MKSGKQWLIVGFLFLLLSLINNLRLSLVPAEHVLFIVMGIFALITGIFEIKQILQQDFIFYIWRCKNQFIKTKNNLKNTKNFTIVILNKRSKHEH
jgi:uncharacterized membrane protein HdeD (DUF308 family)